MHEEIERAIDQSEVEVLRRVVDQIRPPRGRSTEEIDGRLEALVEVLKEDEERLREFREALRSTISESRLVHALAESGILADVSFFLELRNRLGRRILPRHPPVDDVRRHIRKIFHDPGDWAWVSSASPEAWQAIASLVVDEGDCVDHASRDVLGAIQGLAQRIGASGIDEELNAKLHEVEDYESPFLDLTIDAHDFLEDHRARQGTEESFTRLMSRVEECREIIIFLRKNKSIYGTSLRLTALSRRILQQLDRLELLTHLIRPKSPEDLCVSSVSVFRTLVESTQNANSIMRLFRESADLVAYQITEESARKGQKYITDSRSGYFKFLRAAFQGGAIVVAFAFVKLYLATLPLSLAGQALVYSLNYAACFVLLYLTGSILATKQPAVLASTIARKIDAAANRKSLIEGVADVIILAWRSQFVAFLGNLTCALPLAWFVGYAMTEWGGVVFVDEAKAAKLMASVHPWESGALFYAAIAGIFLFAAGVVTGAVENHAIYAEYRQRIAEHPRLAFLGERRKRVGEFLSENLSMISGNVALGFFLGCAGPIGVILGLPFDIRHVAFSSANVGVSVFAAPELLDWKLILAMAIGVSGIGFVNFLVSFLVTLSTALDSRDVTFQQTRDLVAMLLSRLARNPGEWFFPPRTRKYSLPVDDDPAS